MVSEAFKRSLKKESKTEAKIIMGQSLVMDPTGVTFDKMKSYAEKRVECFVEEHDGLELDENSENWNMDYLDLQLTKLTGNFSEKRIDHVKKICEYIYSDKKEKILQQRVTEAKNKENIRARNESRENTGNVLIAVGLLVAVVGLLKIKPLATVLGTGVSVCGAVYKYREKNR